ncbi:MAG: S49 family peptidase [Gammaproteobacteria bacterium]|nr:S49 family peptidase [Gammaproteobacteria bacterium]MCH9743834.1 S49 family peptidase [Gammaproteobacteria bacterium]
MSEEKINEHIVNSLLKDRRSDRIWRLVRTLIWAFILIIYAILIFSPSSKSDDESGFASQPYVSLVRLTGPIMPGAEFSARKTIPLLIKAFKDKKSKGVILLINSPGGSPVQASIIHDKIEALKLQYHKQVIVVGEDALASAAYLISTAADKIYVNADTLTGSVGVIMSGFGFTDAIHKLGIQRRVFAVGDNKDRLDPFEPVNPQDKQKIYGILNQVHQNFIDDVIKGRGTRLHGDRKKLFSGDFWLGAEATKLGLVDGTANVWTVMKKQFNVMHYKDYSSRPSIIESLLKGTVEALHIKLSNDAAPLQSRLN